MSFVSKAFGGSGLKAQAAAQQQAVQQQLSELQATQRTQAEAVAEREARTAAAERAQRAVRSGRRRGLLAYTDNESSTSLGGSSA